MNQQQAQTTIVTSLALSGVLVVVKDLRGHTSTGPTDPAEPSHLPPLRLAVGLCFAGVGLAVTAQFAPELAGGLAILIGLASLLTAGPDALAGIKTASAPPPKGPTK